MRVYKMRIQLNFVAIKACWSAIKAWSIVQYRRATHESTWLACECTLTARSLETGILTIRMAYQQMTIIQQMKKEIHEYNARDGDYNGREQSSN